MRGALWTGSAEVSKKQRAKGKRRGLSGISKAIKHVGKRIRGANARAKRVMLTMRAENGVDPSREWGVGSDAEVRPVPTPVCSRRQTRYR